MKIVTISPGFPDPSTGGGGNWGSILIREFRLLGYEVTHIGVIGKHASIKYSDELENKYREIGVGTVVVPYISNAAKKKGLFQWLFALAFPSAKCLFPNEFETAHLVRIEIEKVKPDCIVSFAWDAQIYSDGVDFPRVGVQAEGEHINTLVNMAYDPPIEPGWSFSYLYTLLSRRALSLAYERLSIALASRMTLSLYQGAHYVAWARRKGLMNVGFVTTPVPEPNVNASTKGAVLRKGDRIERKIRILTIGHLGSTSNRSGLPLLFEEILPSLEELVGRDGFEVHIVGKNEGLPVRWNGYRSHPSLVWRGPVYPADEEFELCDVLLVPIPAPTGSRVRIINGFSFGCAIVAHSANHLAMPELEHGKNILLGSTGKELARHVVALAQNEALKREIGRNGRRTFEDFYAVDLAIRQYDSAVRQAVAMHKFYKSTKILKPLRKWKFDCSYKNAM